MKWLVIRFKDKHYVSHFTPSSRPGNRLVHWTADKGKALEMVKEEADDLIRKLDVAGVTSYAEGAR